MNQPVRHHLPHVAPNHSGGDAQFLLGLMASRPASP